MSKEKHQCEGQVPHDQSVTFYQCTRNGSVKRGDHYYCKQHDPVAQEARQTGRQMKQQAEFDARQAILNRRAACETACEGFPDPQELRRQRDEAVEILRPVQWGMSAESLHAIRAFIETVDSQGETP